VADDVLVLGKEQRSGEVGEVNTTRKDIKLEIPSIGASNPGVVSVSESAQGDENHVRNLRNALIKAQVDLKEARESISRQVYARNPK